jgi:protein-tyrosine phosphatase
LAEQEFAPGRHRLFANESRPAARLFGNTEHLLFAELDRIVDGADLFSRREQSAAFVRLKNRTNAIRDVRQTMTESFVDIHCHLLPGIDDGARDWDQSLAMARLAVDDGTTTIIATPHQLGNYSQNRGDEIRRLTAELQEQLQAAEVPLTVLAGGEIRIEPGLVAQVVAGDLMSLGDHRRHVLLELPHELYLPLEPVLDELAGRQMVGILAHPERNGGLRRQPELVESLVDAGCMMQITAGSLCGTLGSDAKGLAEWMIDRGLVHLVATDAHGPRSRRPLMGRAYERLCELVDEATAVELCTENPRRVAEGKPVPAGRVAARSRRRTGWWARRASA